MNATIWKFPMPITDIIKVNMPVGSNILTAQVDQKTGKLCVWATVDPTAPMKEEIFEIHGTGNPIELSWDYSRQYISTFQIARGEFVGHLFWRVPKIGK